MVYLYNTHTAAFLEVSGTTKNLIIPEEQGNSQGAQHLRLGSISTFHFLANSNSLVENFTSSTMHWHRGVAATLWWCGWLKQAEKRPENFISVSGLLLSMHSISDQDYTHVSGA
jgi:hypothetical protein